VFGVEGSGPGGHPETRAFQFLPVKFSIKAKFESVLLYTSCPVISNLFATAV
jgi:hypothetical protein